MRVLGIIEKHYGMRIEQYWMMEFIGKHIGMVILLGSVGLIVWACWEGKGK